MQDDKTKIDVNKLLDEVLRTEPEFTLPDNFAGMLAEKMRTRSAWDQYLKEFLIYLAVIVGIIAVSAGMAFIWYDANWNKCFDFLLANTSLVAGANILLVFILFADRVLLRYFMCKSSTE